MRPEERDLAYLWDMHDSRHPEFPWRQISRQRNVLAHEYDDIRHEFIWAVARERIPELIPLIAPFISSE
jgi:uncharacterized protein with HEPN domain